MKSLAIAMIVVSVAAIAVWSWVLPNVTTDGIAEGGNADSLRRWMMGLVTAVVLGVSLFVILKKDQDEGSKKWAFGAVGTIMGFWLKQES